MKIIVATTCPFCGRTNEIAVEENDYWDWKDGANAQDAFFYLSADERETLISGICPTCWNETFSEEKESSEEDFDDCDYEIGFDPYLGCFSDDC